MGHPPPPPGDRPRPSEDLEAPEGFRTGVRVGNPRMPATCSRIVEAHRYVETQQKIGNVVIGGVTRLHVEAELHHVAVADQVILALQANLAELARFGPRAELEQVPP